MQKLWTPELGSYGGRRSKRVLYYNAFIPDDIADLDARLSLDVIGVVTEAHAAIADLQASRLEGMDAIARMLLRGESCASSRIEGLSISHRRLAQALFNPSTADETAKAVLGNIAALDQAIKFATAAPNLTVDHILAIHKSLLRHTQDAAIAGRFRDRPGWLGGAEDNPGRAEYIPPPYEEIPRLMDDLVEFMERRDMPSLVHAALTHAQFELIHPFGDGNGRVGRALIQAQLRRAGLAATFAPPISMVLQTNAEAYMRGFRAFRHGDLDGWCGLFAAAARQAARVGEELILKFDEMERGWVEQAGRPRAHSTARAILRMLPARPVVDASSVSEALQVSEVAARNALNSLQDAGILSLTRVTSWRRAWAAKDVINLMNQYERTVAEIGEAHSAHGLLIT